MTKILCLHLAERPTESPVRFFFKTFLLAGGPEPLGGNPFLVSPCWSSLTSTMFCVFLGENDLPSETLATSMSADLFTLSTSRTRCVPWPHESLKSVSSLTQLRPVILPLSYSGLIKASSISTPVSIRAILILRLLVAASVLSVSASPGGGGKCLLLKSLIKTQ